MKSLLKSALVVMLVLVVAAPAAAQEKKKKKNRKKGRNRGPVAQLVAKVHKLDGITDEQKAKIKKAVAELGPKVMEANKKANSVVSDEQRKAMNAARKKATSEGKKGRDLQKAVVAAAKLTDEQKKKRSGAFREQRVALVALQKAVNEILTPEQRKAAKLNLRASGKKGKKGRKKGKKKKKADN